MSARPPDELPAEARPWNDAHPAPSWKPPAPRRGFDRSRLAPTFVVAAIMAGVVLGGIGLDRVMAAPSAGTVALGGSIEMDAAPGWVLAPAGASDGPAGSRAVGESSGPSASGGWIELRKSDALLYATVIDQSYSGGAAAILSQQETDLESETAQVSFGDEQNVTVGTNPTAMAVFEAVVSDTAQSGTVDGELVAMVVDGHAVAIEVFIPQGGFGSISDDVAAMVSSVRAAP